MLYHVEATAERESRTMLIDRIRWDEDEAGRRLRRDALRGESAAGDIDYADLVALFERV